VVNQGLQTLLAVTIVAAVAPIIAAALPGGRVPQVVVLIFLGIVIGPHGLGLADTVSIQLLSNIGLGFLFLLAGYELDLRLFRQQPGRLAMTGWAVSAALSVGVVAVLASFHYVRDFVPVALALTTTALGTLLPILRDNEMLSGGFGRDVLAAGAVGELFPIIAISVFLTRQDQFVALGSLLLVALAALVLLILLLVAAEKFGLDVVLGAMLAGIVLRRWTSRMGGDVESLEGKLDAVGYGIFIPIFFVSSGMTLDIHAILGDPLRLVVFLVLLLAVRGLPALLIYRRVLPLIERFEMTFITATTMPLLIALAEIGLKEGTMLPANAAALVGAGVLSVLIFPSAASALDKRARAARTAKAEG
jgi:Kef-type K+ transport system membrane component KefB